MRQLRPDARIVRHDALGLDAGQELPDLLDRLRQPRAVDRQVVRVVHPLDVGPEADAARDVERQMRAEPAQARLWRRVDQVRGLGQRGRVREVVALGVVHLLVLRGRQDHVIDVAGAQPRGVDDRLGRERALLPGLPVLRRDGPAAAALVA